MGPDSRAAPSRDGCRQRTPLRRRSSAATNGLVGRSPARRPATRAAAGTAAPASSARAATTPSSVAGFSATTPRPRRRGRGDAAAATPPLAWWQGRWPGSAGPDARACPRSRSSATPSSSTCSAKLDADENYLATCRARHPRRKRAAPECSCNFISITVLRRDYWTQRRQVLPGPAAPPRRATSQTCRGEAAAHLMTARRSSPCPG